MHKNDPMKYVHNILKILAFQMSHGQNFPPIESQKHWPIVIGDKVHPFFFKNQTIRPRISTQKSELERGNKKRKENDVIMGGKDGIPSKMGRTRIVVTCMICGVEVIMRLHA